MTRVLWWLTAMFAATAPLARGAHAQNEGGIRVEIYPARDTAAFGYVEEFFRRSNLMEAVAWEMRTRLYLPGWLHLAAGECGHGGASYSAPQRMVLVCYELVDSVFRAAQRVDATPEQRSGAVSFVVTWIVLNRLAYPVAEWFGIDSRSRRDLSHPQQRVEDRWADAFAVNSFQFARFDSPLSRHAQWLQTGGRPALALLSRALPALGATRDPARQTRVQAMTCWISEWGPNYSRLALLIPEAERKSCQQDAGRVLVAVYGSLLEYAFEGSERPPATYVADFTGPWRTPPSVRPRRAAGPAGVDQTPDGGWTFVEEIGHGGREPLCASGTHVYFSRQFGRPTVNFRLARCEEPFSGTGRREGISTIYASGSSLFFVAGNCVYSGAPVSPGQLRGVVRCDAGKGADRSPAVRGSWSSTSLSNRPFVPIGSTR